MIDFGELTDEPAPVVIRDLLPKQAELCMSLAPEVLYSGALGAGKSFAGCSRILQLAQAYPGSTHAIVRKKLVTLRKTTMQTFFKEVCPPEHVVRWHKTDMRATIRSGPHGDQTSDILFVGMVTDRGEAYNIRSLTLGSAFYDETVEATETEWLELGNRLRDTHCPLRQLVGATNPGSRGHWLYRRFFTERDPAIQHTIQATSLDNPHLPLDYVERIKRLKGRYYDRFVLGKWVGFEGLVYDVYDPLLHQVTWREFMKRWPCEAGPDCARCAASGGHPPASWPRVAGIDFGYANPFVYQWWAISPDDEWYRYREIYHSRRLVEHHAKQIRGYDDPVLAAFADHDAEDRATLHHHGVRTRRAKKTRSPGIQAVYTKLSPDAVTGRPGMFFVQGALVEEDPALVHGEPRKPCCTEEELQTYHYPQGSDARNPREEPVDLDNHGCDSMRYAHFTWLKRRGLYVPPEQVAVGEPWRRDVVRREIVRRDITR